MYNPLENLKKPMIKIIFLFYFISLFTECESKKYDNKAEHNSKSLDYDTIRLLKLGDLYVKREQYDCFMKVIECNKYYPKDREYSDSIYGGSDIDTQGDITEIRILNFQGKEIPSCLYELKYLTSILITSSSLEVFPDIGRFRYLEKIKISGNPAKTKELPKIIVGEKSTALKALIIDGYPIKGIEFANRLRLSHLEITYSNLNSIPSSICNLRFLEKLLLYGNPIKDFSFNFSCLPENMCSILIGKEKDIPPNVIEILKKIIKPCITP